MSRWIRPGLASVFVVLVAVFALVFGAPPASMELTLIEASGDVHVDDNAGESRGVAPGLKLANADRITTGAASSAVIATGPTSRIRLGPDTRMSVAGGDSARVSFELEEGRVEATVRPGEAGVRIGRSGRGFQSRNADFAMGVGADGTLAVEVTQGAVEPVGITGEAPRVNAGERALVSARGAVDVEPVSARLLLSVEWPEHQRSREPWTQVVGLTLPGARVVVRGGAEEAEAVADAEGKFAVRVALLDGGNHLAVHAIDPLGRTTDVVEWSVDLDRSGPTFRGGVGAPAAVPR